MMKRIRKTAGLLLVSGTLGLAGLSATAEANVRPTNECELQVRAWCAANWQWVYAAWGYDYCVYMEMPSKCRETGDGGYEEV